jgi:hypothetical protein
MRALVSVLVWVPILVVLAPFGFFVMLYFKRRQGCDD